MVHNNKVLTVSYGTFSCTLEGFEDSFDTMKAIAEYFRDLAADDRYFGAEPPQPDAEMLARIAQREVARQVEAHTSDQGIHLRAATALAPDAAAVAPTAGPATTSEAASQDAPAPAKADAPAPISEPVSETVSEPVAQTDAPASIAPAAPDVPSNATTSVPDIAPPVAADTALAPELADTEDTFGDVELFETAAAEEAAVEENQQVAAEVDFFDVSNEAPGVDTAPTEGSDAEAAAWGVDAALVDASTASEEDHIILPEAETEPTPVSESIAAKLQRIRAVVAKTPPREEEFSEDQHAEGFNVGNAYLEDAVKELEAVGDESADESDAADLIEDTIEADVSDILDQLEAEAASNAPETSSAAQDDDLDATLRAVTEATKAEAERTAAPLAEDAIDRVAQEAPTEEVAPADAPTPEATEDAADTADAEPQLNAKAEPAAEAAKAKVEPRRVRGRVIRVRRAAVSNTLVDATAEDVTPEAAQPAAEPVAEAEPPRPEPTQDIAPAPQSAARDEKPDAQSSLSDADEADLMAELAAVEADLMASGRPAEAPSAAQQEDAQDNGPADTEGFAQETVRLEEQEDFDTAENMPASPTAASLLQRSPGALEGDLSRLMAEADDKLEQADAASSRETYNQLRAAVAAAQAEGSTLDDSAEKDAQAQAYRQDLDSVVRPRRPLGDDAKGAAGRGAPLKLVAEQRIDPDPTPEPIGQVSEPEEVAATLQTAPARAGQPVRPRRVSSAMLSRKSTSGAEGLDTGFADFVRQQGAVELGELLEAAAAYLTKVEGRDQFTRPQLLGKVRGLDDQSSLTREDSLRAFGQLLRDGKLDKASNGRFTTNSQTGFQPGDRAAG